jgi:hypothetical protein
MPLHVNMKPVASGKGSESGPTAKGPLCHYKIYAIPRKWNLETRPVKYLVVDVGKHIVYSDLMITSFANKETEMIFKGERSRLLPPDIQKRALMRLDRLNSAATVEDVRFPPSHHLERLSGNRGRSMEHQDK